MTSDGRIITLCLSVKLLEAIDQAAKANYNSRSGFIRESLVLRLNRQPPITAADTLSQDEALRQLDEYYRQNGEVNSTHGVDPL